MRSLPRIAIFVFLPAMLIAQEPKASKAAALFEQGLNEMTGGAQSQDAVRSIEHIREAARQGYAPAQTAMVFYSQTQQEAAEFCKKAAEQGDVLGQWCIGRAYYLGSGVSRDLTEAERWLRK